MAECKFMQEERGAGRWGSVSELGTARAAGQRQRCHISSVDKTTGTAESRGLLRLTEMVEAILAAPRSMAMFL